MSLGDRPLVLVLISADPIIKLGLQAALGTDPSRPIRLVASSLGAALVQGQALWQEIQESQEQWNNPVYNNPAYNLTNNPGSNPANNPGNNPANPANNPPNNPSSNPANNPGNNPANNPANNLANNPDNNNPDRPGEISQESPDPFGPQPGTAPSPPPSNPPTPPLAGVILLQGQDWRRLLGDLAQWHQWQQYQPLPLGILLLCPEPDPATAAQARLWGARGYCPPGVGAEILMEAVDQIAQGFDLWNLELGNLLSRPRGWRGWLRPWLTSSLRQVDDSLSEILEDPLRPPQPWLDRQIIAGQRRELQAARWCLSQLLRQVTEPAPPGEIILSPKAPISLQEPELEAVCTEPTQIQSLIMAQTQGKMRACQGNLTPLPMEIDILRLGRRQELLGLVVVCLDDRLSTLRQDSPSPEQLATQVTQIWQDVWQSALTDFLHHTQLETLDLLDLASPRGTVLPQPLPPQLVGLDPTFSSRSPNPTVVEVLPNVLQALDRVDVALLRPIPQGLDLLQTLLFGMPLPVDGVPQEIHSPAALDRLGLLTENLVIQIANGVMQPLLNRFGDVERLKQTLYDKRLISTRDVERFRNSLSWKYQITLYWEKAQDIYESRYWLWRVHPQGFDRVAIYGPRRWELAQLDRYQQGLTLALELRDTLAPRLQVFTAWLGQGVVYVLTQIIGRAIGLVGRGILQGIGSTWGDFPPDRRP